MPEIRLNRGLVAIVDVEDVELVERYNWNGLRGRKTWYAVAVGETGRVIALHRYLLGFPAGRMIDHINENGLDNRRCNLRFATHSQNAANISKQRADATTSRYKGVWYEKAGSRQRRWRARVRVNGRQVQLGSFLTEQEAARAYDSAAQEHFGEYAKLNFNK